MNNTVSIHVSTYKKIFVTKQDLKEIKIVLQSNKNPSNTFNATLSLETYTCVFENVEPGSYTAKAYSIDSQGNTIGDELSGTINVQSDIPAPGQLIEPATWESYQKITAPSFDDIKNIELPSLMHIIIT